MDRLHLLEQLEFGAPLFPQPRGTFPDPRQELSTPEDKKKWEKEALNTGRQFFISKNLKDAHGCRKTFARPVITSDAEAKLEKRMSGKKTPESPSRKYSIY